MGRQYAANDVRQGVEQLIEALLLARGLEAGLEHRLEALAGRLPPDDPWHTRLEAILHDSAFATAFRYPTPGARIVSKPPAADVLRDVAHARALVGLGRSA